MMRSALVKVASNSASRPGTTCSTPGLTGRAKSRDAFGWAVASGHFGPGGADDLAVGIPGRDVGESRDAGAVALILGSAFMSEGLTSNGSQILTQDNPGVRERSEEGDRFGLSVG